MIQDVVRVEDIEEFTRELFARDEGKAARIIHAILEARSARLSDLCQHMEGHPSATYKMLERFLKEKDILLPLLRLFDASAPFVIGDPTEIPPPQRPPMSAIWLSASRARDSFAYSRSYSSRSLTPLRPLPRRSPPAIGSTVALWGRSSVFWARRR